MGESVSYASGGGTAEAYLALPACGSGPSVIVLQEWWGLVPHIKTLADRFADAGFVALAPDLYHGEQAMQPQEAGRLAAALVRDQVADELCGAADFLAARDGASPKVGAVGFSLGGSLALWAPACASRVVAAVGFYPRLPWDWMDPDWAAYAGKAAMIHCCEQDGLSQAQGVKQACAAIEASGGSCVVHDYPGTKHAFFNDDRPESFDRSASASAWARTLELFRTRL